MSQTHWTESDIVWLKREASKRKKESGKKLGHVIEQLAQEQGFKTYAAMRAAVKDNQPKEQKT